MISTIRRMVLALFMFAAIVVPLTSAEAKNYRIGPSDLIEISVLGEKEFSGNFRVRTDGVIDFPHLGTIQVKGKTAEDVSNTIVSLLKEGYLISPQVSVEVKEFKSQQVIVLGAVKNPGTFMLKEDTRIIDLISLVGGILPSGSKRILLLRKTSSADASPIVNGDGISDLSEGERKGPRSPVEISTDNMSDAVEDVDENSKVSTSTDLSGKALASEKPIVIDYNRLAQDGDLSQNMLLRGGDIINVPQANEIFVMGNVAKPGPVQYQEKLTVLQAVTLAGGPTEIASTKSTYILRQGTNGEEKIPVRLDRILENKEKNILLKPDDVIVVPESFF